MTNNEAFRDLNNKLILLNREAKDIGLPFDVKTYITLIKSVLYVLENSNVSGGSGSSSGDENGTPIYASTVTGVDVYSGITDPVFTEYIESIYKITFLEKNTGSSSLNLNNVGNVSIKKRLTDGSLTDIEADELIGPVTLIYDSNELAFIVISASSQLGLLTNTLTVTGVGTVGGASDDDTFIKNTPLEDIIRAILIKEDTYTYLIPTASLTKSPSSTYQEVGLQLAITLNATFNQRDGGDQLSYQLKKGGVNLSTDDPYIDTVVLTEGTLSYQGTYTYDDGPILNSNIGNPYPNPIEAGSVNTDIESIQVIYPYFFGSSSDRNVIGSDVYNGTKVVSPGSGTLSIPFSGSDAIPWFAIHENYNLKLSWVDPSNPSVNNGSIGGEVNPAGNLFPDPITIAVTSVGLNSNYTENYKVYIGNSITSLITLQIKES